MDLTIISADSSLTPLAKNDDLISVLSIKDRLDASGCMYSSQGDNNRLFSGFRINGGVNRRDLKIRYHGCVGHRGAITTPEASSVIIFCKVRDSSAKGGKA